MMGSLLYDACLVVYLLAEDFSLADKRRKAKVANGEVTSLEDVIQLIQASREPVNVAREVDRIERSVDFYKVLSKQLGVADFKSLTCRKALKAMLSTRAMLACCYNKFWPRALHMAMIEFYRKHIRNCKPGVEVDFEKF